MNRVNNFINNTILKYKWIIVFLLAIPFYNDAYTLFKLAPDWIMDHIKILVFIILIVLMIKDRKKPSLLLISLAAIELWWFISTLFNYSLTEETVYHKLIIDMVNALTVALIVEYFSDSPDDLFSGLMLNFETTIYPNFLLILFGITRDANLLGPPTTLILWQIPAVTVACVFGFRKKNILRALMLVLASILTTVMIPKATSIVVCMGIALFISLGILLRNRFNKKILLSIFFALAILLNLFVLFVYSGGNFPLIDFFIEKVLHKSTTFTDRTAIWQEAIRMIKDKPIIGHGFRPEVHATNQYGTVFIHSHNQLLQRLNATGVIGLVLFIVFHIILCFKVDKAKNTNARIIVAAISFGVFLTYITEAYKKFFRFYLVFFIAYFIDNFVSSNQNNRIKEEIVK